MQSIDYFLDLAKKKIGTTSDRELARQLDLTTVSTYRKKNVIPDDFTAMKLADLCNLPGHEVMITCHLLKAAQGEHPEIHTQWKDILKMVSNACIALFFVVTAAFLPASADAVIDEKNGAIVHSTSGHTINYATLFF